jgi:DNA modification methylase
LGEWDDELLKVELEELKEADFELELTGFSLEEIDEFLDEIEVSEEQEEKQDEIPIVETEIPPFTQTGDLWLLGEHRLLCGDATKKEDVERLMNGEKADMVFTDPPYGVCYADKNEFLNRYDKGNRVQKEIKNDHLSIEELQSFLFLVFSNIKKVLAEYSSYYITAPQGGDLLYVMMSTIKEAGIPLRHMLIWNKNNHVLGRVDYMYKHEPILYGWVDKHKFYGKGQHTKSVWDIPKPLKSDLHPTMKPVELIENAILNSTLKGQIVLDVFGGSGSTLIACEKTKRKARLMELDEHYCDVIVKRYLDFSKREDITLIRNGKKIQFSEIKSDFLKRFSNET